MTADGNAANEHGFNTTFNGGAESLGASQDQIANAAVYRHTAEGNVLRGSGPTATPIFKFNAAFADGHGETVPWNVSWEVTDSPFPFSDNLVAVPTMWRQVFRQGTQPDAFDNPNTTEDDGNPRS